MTNKEKVIKGLECCCSPTTYDCRNRCPYTSLYELGNGYKNCMAALLPDALALLKEQEAVEPEVEVLNETDRIYRCPKCHKCFFYKQQKYCDQCGQEVKWE